MKLPISRRTLLLLVIVGLVALSRGFEQYTSEPADKSNSTRLLEQAYAQQSSDLWLTIQARVVKLLPDDNKGDRHQRFIIDPGVNFTVLVAHNIDIAPRVPLSAGDPITLRGEYEWNSKGGVLHWTHHDPGGRRDGGWIEHKQQRYQ